MTIDLSAKSKEQRNWKYITFFITKQCNVMQSNANEFIFKHIYQIFVQNTMLVFIYLEN